MFTEKQVRMAAKLYEARDSMRGLFGARYQERLSPYREIIRGAMAKHSCDELEAVLEIKRFDPSLDGVELAMLLAAAVEEVESTSA